jgi:hypothetical protein
MRIEILEKAEDDLFEGYLFYEAQEAGLGSYFLESLFSDIESLRLYAGVHRRAYRNYHRILSRRFPFAVFYTVTDAMVYIHAVVDCRRRPAWIREHLR